MNSDAVPSRRPSLTIRLTVDEKRRFAALAARRGQSEAALGLDAVRRLLDLNGDPLQVTSLPPLKEPASDRITIRLRPGDRRAITVRARLRGTKASTYLAGLVRAHVSTNPPLTTNELAALKQAVVVLAGFGRLMALVAKGAAQADALPRDWQQDLSRTRALIATLEQRVHDFVRAALMSWESRSG